MAKAKRISPFWAEKLYPSVVPRANPTEMILAPDAPTELKPTGYSPEEIRRWIKALSRRLDIAPTTLAKKAGLAPSTVNRFLKGSGLNENVSAATIAALTLAAAELYGTSLDQMIDDEAAHMTEELDGRFDPSGRSPLSIPVVGQVEAGVFQEAVEWPVEEQYQVHAPIQNTMTRKPVIGLEVRGHSMDKVYPEGTIVICVPFYSLDRNPRSGERVVVNKRGQTGVESTVKEFLVDERGDAWLVPLSTRPEHQAPIHLGKQVADDALSDDLLITLLVIGSYRPEPHNFMD